MCVWLKPVISTGPISTSHDAVKMPISPESLRQISVIVAYDSHMTSEYRFLPS